GKRVIGILFHVVTASVDRKNDKYSLGEQFNAHPLAPEGSADYATFKQLCDALAKLQRPTIGESRIALPKIGFKACK
ncbi:MAG: hypothetical protein ACREQV_00210, partial [Candidatus Binatia bacterium]